jgi:UDP-N-acetyl-2-amino-2-deoxyglucuronate dehydrogenase
MRRIGVGIVGLGNAVKPHAAALKALGDRVLVVGGYSPSAPRRAQFATTYGLPVVASLDALLADPKVEALFVLTPPRTHTEIALAAARAGKEVLLEKPVDVDFARSKALVDEVERAGRVLGIVFQHRFREASIALREVLRANGLGDLLSVSASIRWWRSDEYFAEPGRGTIARDGGGVLLTQAIHTLDLMLDLAGPPARVSALVRTSPLRRIDTEDIACATVQYRNGAVGVIDATTVAYPGYPERVEIAGTKGSAVLAAERLELNLRDAPVRVIDGGSAGGGGADPMAFSPDAHRRLIADFLDAVESRRQPQASARSALAIHALIDAIQESSRRGAAVDVAS